MATALPVQTYIRSTPLGEVVQRYSQLIGRPIDNTALSIWLSCRRKYLFSMVLHARRDRDKAALSYGGLWHKILEVNYRTGGDFTAIAERAALAWPGDFADDHRTLNRALNIEYPNYIRQWGLPEEEAERGNGTTIGYPEAPLLELPLELPIPGARHPYGGKLDRIFGMDGKFYIEDHKTTSRFDKNYFTEWEMSPQMMGYAVLAYLHTGKPIAGVRINLHVIRKNDSEFHRRIVTFSVDRLREWIWQYDIWLGELERAMHADLAGRMSSDDVSQWDESTNNAFPPNFNTCTGRYGQCEYFEICSLGPRHRMRALRSDYPTPNPWNPFTTDD